MARGINKVLLIGHLGKDPEAKNFANGGSLTNITLATSESWKDKDGQTQERTEWHSVVFHNKLGEIVAQYLRKGSKIYIEGSLRTRKWQDKEGRDRYTTEVHAHEMQMLDSRPAESTRSASTEPDRGYAEATGRSTRAPSARGTAQAAPFDDPADDIPF